MNGQTTFSQAQAEPGQILAIFQDWQRHELGHNPDEKEIVSFQTTVSDWLDQGDFPDWKRMSKGLNKFFATNFSKDEWRAVMKPENKKTLLDVCTLISSRATLPALNETKFLGASCKTASAFLALRASLQGAGVNVTGLRPSSKLDNVLRLHLQTIANAVSKLAPGRMPKIRSRSNLAFKIFAWMALASLTVFIASEFVAAPLLSAVSCVTLILSFMGVGICSSLPPAEVHFEGLETFADLSRLIAGGIENRKTKLAL